MRTAIFLVKMEIPDGATKADCEQYLGDAVAGWRGSLQSPSEGKGDLMFHLNPDSIEVRPFYRKRSK